MMRLIVPLLAFAMACDSPGAPSSPTQDESPRLGGDVTIPDSVVILALNLHCLELYATRYQSHEERFAAIAALVDKESVGALAIQEACKDDTIDSLELLLEALESKTGEEWSSVWFHAHMAWEGTDREADEGLAIVSRGQLQDAREYVYMAQPGLRRVAPVATLPPSLGNIRLVSMHLDHRSPEGRLAQARETAAYALADSAPSSGVVVAGDLNAREGSEPYEAFLALGYDDASLGIGANRIDHVFVYQGGAFAPASARLVFNTRATAISDHPGVLVRLTQRAPEPPKTTRIAAVVDVGFGNSVSVRGSAPPLSWDFGWPMLNVEANRWEIVLPGMSGEFEFKLLKNDVAWQHGDNLAGSAGGEHEVWPAF